MSKVLVIGLDGVPLHLLESWAEEGRVPTLKRLMDEGAVTTLNSTIPHTSGPAWSSFMTGKNPAKTDIYDFLHRRKNSYAFFPNSSQSRDGKAVWDILSETGKRVGVVNVPLTYPVKAVNGCFISGFMTPYHAKDFMYPPELLSELEAKIGKYKIYPLETFNEDRPQLFFDGCHRLADLRTEATLHLMERDPWDFFMTTTW